MVTTHEPGGDCLEKQSWKPCTSPGLVGIDNLTLEIHISQVFLTIFEKKMD